MADILIDNQGAPTTPAASKSILWIDSTTKKLVQTDDSGLHHGDISRNNATASQVLGVGDTYVTNSGLLIPSFGMQAGQFYRWWVNVSKTAAGVAAPVFIFRLGTNQTTADTAILTLTAATAQAANLASCMFIVTLQVRNVSATGVVAGAFAPIQATTFPFGSGIDGVSGTFDNTGKGGQFLGLSINAGAASAWTVSSAIAELLG